MKQFDVLMAEILKVSLEMKDFIQIKKRTEIFTHIWSFQTNSLSVLLCIKLNFILVMFLFN